MKKEIKVIKKEKIFCSICGEEHEIDLCEELVETNFNGEEIEYLENYYRCNKYPTENTFVTGDMWNKQLLAMKEAYNIKMSSKKDNI